MAEAGRFGNYVPEPEYQIKEEDLLLADDDKGDTTRPFQPTAASTPFNGREQYEMQTMMHEQSGLPDTSYEETPLLSADERTAGIKRRLDALRENSLTGLIDTGGVEAMVNPLSQEDKEEQIRRVKRLIKARFPNANVDRLVISYSTKRPMDIVVKGPKGGETKIVLNDGSDLQKSFINKDFVKKELGPPAGDFIQKTSSDIRKKQKELKDLRTSEQFLRSKDEEIRTLNERLYREQAKIDQLKEDQGTDNKAEIKRKEQMVKNLEKDLKSKKKEVGELQKKMRTQEKTQERIDQLQSTIYEEERKRNAMEERLNSTKLLML